MKSTRAKLLLGSLLPGIIAMAVAPAVYARSIAAYAGNPLQNKARTCFTESNGAVQAGLSNTNCPGVWEVNLPVDTAGSYTVSYTGLVTGGIGSVSCGAYAVAPDGSFAASTNYKSATTSSFATVTLDPISVPSGGNLFIACNISNGAVGTINW